MRWDDFSTTMSSGPRSGQYVLQQVRTRLMARGINFLQARADDGTCAPGRASLITGMLAMNHGIGPGNTADDYYDFYRQGKKQSATTGTGGKSARWVGPWEFDRAKQNGYADTPLTPSSQGTVGGTTTIAGHGITRANANQRADATTPDDLQAFTGGLPNWLSVNGVRCGLVGKYQNAYADTTDNRYTTPAQTYLFVPPGWSYWAALCGTDTEYNGGAQDHWRVHTTEFSGSNAGDGNGTTGTEVAYRYDLTVTSISYTSGVATVTVNSAAPHRMSVGDEFHLEGASPTGLCTTVGQAGYTVASVIDAYRFTYATSVSGTGTATTAVGAGSITCYARVQYGDQIWGERAIDFVNSCTAEEPWYLYLSPDNPHQGTVGTAAVDSNERERRYVGTVNPADFANWSGVPGAVSPVTIGANATTGRKQQWQQRQEMLASTDDAIGAVLDACEARGWTNVIVVFTSDNGFQVGEQEAREGSGVWDMLGGKGFVYDGSCRLPFIIRHPKWAQGTTSNLLVSQADVPLTVLDWFGLTAHHAHTKRDGYSIQRLIADLTDPTNSRAQIISRGDYLGVKSEAIIGTTLKKLIRPWSSPTSLTMFDRSTDTDYELTDIVGANATEAATLSARLNVLRDGRWNGTVNTCRTA